MATAPEMNGSQEHTLPPFLRRVRIRGYKSIAFCDVQLQPLTILVGRNAAGKSNFLDALALLRDVIDLGAGEAVKRRGGWSSVAARNAKAPSIELEVEATYFCGRPVQRMQVDDSGNPVSKSKESPPNLEGHHFTARYFVEIVSVQNGPPAIKRETLDIVDDSTNEKGGFDSRRYVHSPRPAKSEKNGGGGLVIGGADVLHWKRGPAWSKLAIEALSGVAPQRADLCLLSVIGLQPFLELSEGLRYMGFYNFHPDAIRTYQKPNPGWLLEKDGSNLASVIEGLKEIEPRFVERVRDYLGAIAEEVVDYGNVRYGENETVQFKVRADQETLAFDAASMSDGTLRALASLVAAFQIHLPFGPSVVGIEEPETALHPAALRALVDALDDATQHTQIILTTHSADILSGRDVNPGQVLVVRNRSGKTQITPLDPASHEIVEKELYSLADLQRMDKLELDEADLKRQSDLAQGGM